jgi:light-regulated signal transduction histidine kinase (bacteriophytochrome)
VVSSYLELLGESVRPRLENEEETYLDRAAAATMKVQEMVDAVLGYARIDTRGGEFREVDFNAVLGDVKDALWEEIKSTKAEITSDALPIVTADPSQMEQLLRNLVSNALKFSGDGPARVKVAVEEQETEWQLSVRDVGIGIDPEAVDRIFLMFQRLHTEKEYPGTGIGLAVCKRIVDRHGGRIWVESQLECGATFYFTIPKRPAVAGEQSE